MKLGQATCLSEGLQRCDWLLMIILSLLVTWIDGWMACTGVPYG